MQNTPTDTKINDHGSSPHDEDGFIPINPDWRKKYYKRVLKKRIKAYLLDVLILYISIITLFVFCFLLDGAQAEGFFSSIAYLVFTFAYPVFVSIIESSKWKGFFGKRIMKIEVSDNYGNPISFWRSIWRNILKGITFYVCCTIIGYFIQKHYYLKTGKLIHDYLSNTIIGERLGN